MSLDKISFKEKIKAVRTYLATKQSLRKIAQEINIPYQTLWFWVKQYKEGGAEKLREKRVHPRRLSKEIETKVMYLKEGKPSLTLNNAVQLLRKDGIIISKNAIWQIWRRYGLIKRPIHDPLCPFCVATPESNDALAKAKRAIRDGDLRAAAKILNNAPCLPEDSIVKEIPEKFLSPRRRLDCLYIDFGKIPFLEFRRKARRIAQILEKKGYIYSSIITYFFELMALAWLQNPDEEMILLNLLSKKMRNIKNTSLLFLFYSEQALIYSKLLRMRQAFGAVKKCRKLVNLHPSNFNWRSFGTLLSYLGRHREAITYHKRAFSHEKNPRGIADLALKIAAGHWIAGEYEECKKMFSQAGTIKNAPGFGAAYSVNRANLSFGQGNLSQATKYFLESLEKTTKEQLNNMIYATSGGLATVAMALNKKSKGRMHLKKYLPLMEKHKLLKEALLWKQLLGSKENIPDELLLDPTICLLNLLICAKQTMKIGDYRRAFNFARRQRLLGLFHRLIVFFPELVVRLLEKGRPTGLPKTVLKFPIFNGNVPVYHIKFLGDVVISKHRNYVRTKPSPQEKAFLIHLALKAGTPGKSILLNELYENFWAHSTKPSSLLSHLLTRLKKRLMLPSHLLSISSSYGEPRLVNRGVYITTDYGEFMTFFTQVKSLERVDEWYYAKKDYLRAFKLLRGAPFKKMYDNWSEQMRSFILNKLESEVVHFTKGCLKHNSKEDAKRVLEKVTTILPQSHEVNVLLKKL